MFNLMHAILVILMLLFCKAFMFGLTRGLVFITELAHSHTPVIEVGIPVIAGLDLYVCEVPVVMLPQVHWT